VTGHHRVKSILTLALLLLIPTIPDAQDVVVDVPACLRPPAAVVYPEPAPGGPESIFEDEVWAKIGERTCLNCHVTGGDAAESKFILRDPALHPDHLQHNRQMFEKMASLKKDGKSRLLVKVSGGLDHGGVCGFHPVIAHGTSPTTTPGASAKWTALMTARRVFSMAVTWWTRPGRRSRRPPR